MITCIGDVHGWSDRLDRLLAKCDGELLFMGDLIDRGPDAPGVIDRVRDLCVAGRARCILGNHEFALVRGLGVPGLGIPSDPELYEGWFNRYGGDALCRSLGVPDGDAERVRERLGDRLDWLARLPWILDGHHGNRRWIAVHAGLGTMPWQPQVADLRSPQPWWTRTPFEHPPALYSKPRARLIPGDLPPDICIFSGHTPVTSVVVTPTRVLCDTSGGLPHRVLSAVVWPLGKVITS